jgi:hypothetical protein
MDIPITYEALASFGGGLFLAFLAGQWLAKYLKDWRWTNLLVLGVTIVLIELAHWLTYGAEFTGRQAGLAAFWGFFAASAETLGYETVLNVLGRMGVGKRSDEGIKDAAITTLVEANILALDVVPNECPPTPGSRTI